MTKEDKSRRKILYVEGCKDGTVGGSHTCLYTLVSNLDKHRFHPTVIFYYDHAIAVKLRSAGIETHIFENLIPLDCGLLLQKIAPFLQKLRIVFVPLQKSINFIWYLLKPAIVYAKYMRRKGIDILHLNNSIISNHDWILAGKLAGVKIVSHERGINYNLSKTSKMLGRTLDLLICVSKAVYDPLCKQGIDKTETMIVYDGIDTSEIIIKNKPESLKQAYGIGKDDPVVGVVGNIKQWKGQETIVRAMAIIKKSWPTIKCPLVGGMIEGDSYKEKLETIIKELDISGNVIFTGYKDNPIDFMNIMDVVVHTSIEPEPFGMINLEAMYMKKPVISTNIGGPTEVFEDGVDGILIEPGNPELLAQKISWLLENPSLRTELGQKAYEKLITKFKITDTVSAIENIYESLCER